jgi:hypothetical protein
MLTWLNLHQGAQVEETTQVSGPPPHLVWDAVRQNGKAAAFKPDETTVTTVTPDPSVMSTPTTLDFVLKNDGQGPLQLRLLSTSCGCSEIKLDGQKLEASDKPDAPWAELPPGKTGTLAVTWKVEPSHTLAEETFRLAVTLELNDPQYADRVRLEIASKVVYPPPQPKEGTPK